MVDLENMIYKELEELPLRNSENLRTYTLNVAMAERLATITEEYEKSEDMIFDAFNDLITSDATDSVKSCSDVLKEVNETVQYSNRAITNLLFF